MNALLTTPQPNAACASAPRARILYVDDDPHMRSFGMLALARSGYHVDTAENGAEAWVALQNQDYHLLITDNQMPELTGLELIRKVWQARMTVPVILASGTVGVLPKDTLPWLECGALLAKPFTFEQLVSSVRDVLRAAVWPHSKAVPESHLAEQPEPPGGCRHEPGHSEPAGVLSRGPLLASKSPSEVPQPV